MQAVARQPDASQLAAQLQQIPSLKAGGLMLEGDILTVQGKADAARKAYSNSLNVKESPAVMTRIKALDDRGADLQPFDLGKKSLSVEKFDFKKGIDSTPGSPASGASSSR